jgi:hypothetical protein
MKPPLILRKEENTHQEYDIISLAEQAVSVLQTS